MSCTERDVLPITRSDLGFLSLAKGRLLADMSFSWGIAVWTRGSETNMVQVEFRGLRGEPCSPRGAGRRCPAHSLQASLMIPEGSRWGGRSPATHFCWSPTLLSRQPPSCPQAWTPAGLLQVSSWPRPKPMAKVPIILSQGHTPLCLR